MLNLAGIPFMGRERHRKALQGLRELFKAAVSQHMDASRARVYRREPNPAILDKLLQRGTGMDDVVQPLGRRLNDEKNPDWLVDFNHLPWQSGTQVACVTVHHSHQARDIVRQFRAASVSVVINERKVVFKTDSRAHGDHASQQRRKTLVVGILVGVIGDQKGPPVEKQSSRQIAPPDNANGIRAMPILGSRLREMFATFLHVAKCTLRIRIRGAHVSNRRTRSSAFCALA